MQLKEKALNFPRDPGVYLIRSKGQVIYVGKASSLRDRISSYFGSSAQKSPKMRTLTSQMDDLEYIVTDSEVEALILEENLIKEHRPKFNVHLKDNKRYPYVVITDEKFPRLEITRKITEGVGDYFGPYTDVGALRTAIRTVEEVFPIRDCSWSSSQGWRRPCLRFHINSCSAPCAGKVSQDEYSETVNRVRKVLTGQYEKVRSRLDNQMEKAARSKNYERAANLRDKISALDKITKKQSVRINDTRDQDYIAMDANEYEAVVQIIFLRRGRIAGTDSFEIDFPRGTTRDEILNAFIKDFYKDRKVIPGQIKVPFPPSDVGLLNSWLSSIRGKRVDITVPKRGKKTKIIRMAQNNASFNLNKLGDKSVDFQDDRKKQIARELELGNFPRRIEGYDISTIGGRDSVGSMVVFENGEPKRSAYRRFKINSEEGPDDFGMMKEVLERRLKHGLKERRGERKTDKFSDFPHLIVVDGGKGQLGAAVRAVEAVGIEPTPLLALEKQLNRCYLPNRKEPLILDKDSSALKLLQRVRNEAHRFAVTYHRRVRQKRTVRSSLDAVKGVGPKRKQALLRAFGSIESLRQASLEEIKQVSKLPSTVARKVYDFYNKN